MIALPKRLAAHPVAAFLFLTFLISFGGSWLAGALLGLTGNGATGFSFYLTTAVVVSGPALAALLVSDRPGRQRLLRSLRPERVSLVLWLVLPVLPLVAALVVYNAVGLADPTGLWLENWPVFLLHLAFQIGVVGIGEELGWRGWLLPRLLQRHRLWNACLIIFLCWLLWHLPKLTGPPALSVPLLAMTMGLSFLLALLWVRTGGSTLAAAIAHGAINAPVFFLESMARAGRVDQEVLLRGWWWYALLWLLPALGIVLFSRPADLPRQAERE